MYSRWPGFSLIYCSAKFGFDVPPISLLHTWHFNDSFRIQVKRLGYLNYAIENLKKDHLDNETGGWYLFFDFFNMNGLRFCDFLIL